MNRKPIIGLCGGIGTGKSTVAQLLVEEGCGLIDADANVAELYRDPEFKQRLQQRFGEELLDANREVNRKWLAEVIFNDPYERRRLEAMVHPRVTQRQQQQLEAFQRDAKVRAVVLDVPLLFEVTGENICDWIIFVDSNDLLRQQRVAVYRGWDSNELRLREQTQMPLKQKRELADEVIYNNSSLEECRRQVQQVLARRLPASDTDP